MKRSATIASPAKGQPWLILGNALAGLAQWADSRGAALLLLASPFAGLTIFAALALVPGHLMGALIGVVVGDVVARVTTTADNVARRANICTNGLLGGLSASWLIGPSNLWFPMGVVFVPVVAGLTALLAAALGRATARSTVPILSAAFMLVFGAELTLFPGLASSAATAHLIWEYPVGVEGWIESFLRSLGMIVFDPRPLTGALVLIAVVLSSPLLLVHGLVGWTVGILVAFVLQSMGFSWLWLLSAHNAFVSAALVGAVFFLPSRGSLLLSVVAGALAAVLALVTQIAFSGTAWAFQPIPSMVTVWVLLLAFSSSGPLGALVLNREVGLPAHVSAARDRQRRKRFGNGGPLLIPPVAGRLLVTQAFEGTLTHRGQWRHALDFERPEDAASIYGATVFAPAPGVVESVIDGVPDNLPGSNNFRQNWGNHVIIRLDGGGWLMLAHLALGTVQASVGQRVTYGTALGMVGSSGRSPVPHLHMHVQSSAALGSPTVPFRLANLVSLSEGNLWHANHLPLAGETITGATADQKVLSATAAIMPGIYTWRTEATGEVPRRLTSASVHNIRVAIDAAGQHVFSDADGALTFYADADALRLYAATGNLGPVLSHLALLTLVPYVAHGGLTWRDIAIAPRPGPMGILGRLLAPYGFTGDGSARLRAISAPDAPTAIAVEPDPGGARAPRLVTVTLGDHRGPVEIDARYDNGRFKGQLVHFEPTLT